MFVKSSHSASEIKFKVLVFVMVISRACLHISECHFVGKKFVTEIDHKNNKKLTPCGNFLLYGITQICSAHTMNISHDNT